MTDDLEHLADTEARHGNRDALDAMTAREEKLREALTPFSDAARDRASDASEWRDSDTVAVWVTVGDLRRARAALTDGEEE